MPTPPLSPQPKPNDSQFVSDLANLFRRHRVHCGDTRDLDHLASALQENSQLCGDLFLLCTAISHMGESDLSPEQMLSLVVRAVGGPQPYDGKRFEVPEATRYAFLSRYAQWSSRFAGSSSTTPDPSADKERAEAVLPILNATDLRAVALPAKLETTAGDRSLVDVPSGRGLPAKGVGDLTLRQLSEYLVDLEQRVKRAEAFLQPSSKEAIPFSEGAQDAAEVLPAEVDTTKATADVSLLAGFANETDCTHTPEIFVRPERGKPYFSKPPSEPRETSDASYAEVQPDVQPSQERTPLPLESIAAQEVFAGVSARTSRRSEGTRSTRLVISTAAYLGLAGIAVMGYRYYERASSDADPSNGIPTVISQPLQEVPKHQNHPGMPIPSTHRTRTPARSTLADAHASNPIASSEMVAQHEPSAPPATASDAAVATVPPQVSETAQQRVPAVIPETQPVQLARSTSEARTPASPRQIIEPYNQRSSSEPAAREMSSKIPVVDAAVVLKGDVPKTQAAGLLREGMAGSGLRVVRIPSSNLMPYALNAPSPRYPTGRHLSSDVSVVVRVTISREGLVSNATAVTGPDDLRGAAQQAMQLWRFRPYLVDGTPVEVLTDVRFVFKAP